MIVMYQKRLIIIALMLTAIFSACTKGLHLKVAPEDFIAPEYPVLTGKPVLAWTEKLSSTPKAVEYLAGTYVLIITYPGEVFTMDLTSRRKKCADGTPSETGSAPILLTVILGDFIWLAGGRINSSLIIC